MAFWSCVHSDQPQWYINSCFAVYIPFHAGSTFRWRGVQSSFQRIMGLTVKCLWKYKQTNNNLYCALDTKSVNTLKGNNCGKKKAQPEIAIDLSQQVILQSTMLCYNNGLGPEEKRRTADSFVLIPSAQKQSNRLVNFTAVDRSLSGL